MAVAYTFSLIGADIIGLPLLFHNSLNQILVCTWSSNKGTEPTAGNISKMCAGLWERCKRDSKEIDKR